MIERSQEVFILADHTKFDRSGPYFLSDYSSIDYLITDQKASSDQLAMLENVGVQVVRTQLSQ
jgi:DeoR/GlpR family transcriptional regulator of sugar metabolism